jgi:hypothetical protein
MADLLCFVGPKSKDRRPLVAPPDGIVDLVATKDCLRQVGQLLGLQCSLYLRQLPLRDPCTLVKDLYITVCLAIHDTSQVDIRNSTLTTRP